MLFAYFFLLTFEGVFRKWVKFGSLDFFYVIRDAILFLEIMRQILIQKKKNISIFFLYHFYFILVFGIASLQILFLNMNLTVLTLGIRNYLAPVGLSYYIILSNRRDSFILMLKKTMFPITVLETIIVSLQVISPRNGFVNATPTGNDAIVTSGLQVRPLGTFTSSLGLVYFLTFAYSFCLYELERHSNLKNYLFLTMILFNTLLSGSRTAPISIFFISFVFFVRRFRTRDKNYFSLAKILIVLSIATALVLSIFRKVWEAYLFRLQNQTEGSGGTASRLLQSFSQFSTAKLSILGDGIGVHHASAIPFFGLGTWIESEKLRWSAELGLAGYLLFNIRIVVAISLLVVVIFSKSNKPNFPFIVGFFPMLVVGGISTQPTIQGIAALSLATIVSLRTNDEEVTHG